MGAMETAAMSRWIAELGNRPLIVHEGWLTSTLQGAGERSFHPARAQEDSRTTQRGAVVIPVFGPITKRGSFFGGASADAMAAMVLRAAADEDVSAIVLEFDSPGGTVDGTPEAAAAIRQARKTKPVVAAVNGWAMSGAYWLASQADTIAVTPSGAVGSVGVFVLHWEMARALDAEGITAQIIRQPARKAEANTFEPLGEEARAKLQADVDAVYADFARAVRSGRGLKQAQVAEMQVPLLAAAAVELGAADAIMPVGEAIALALDMGAGRNKGMRRVAVEPEGGEELTAGGAEGTEKQPDDSDRRRRRLAWEGAR